uniref:Mitochondrial carrier protein n=1 Tax=Lotharella globosa TaxID=91324 RepID=A0A7S3YR27_9EUKA
MASDEKLSDNMASVAHSVAGGLSGMISQTILYPLETIKYQQQAAGSVRKLPRMDENGDAEKTKDASPQKQGKVATWSDLLTVEFYQTCYNGLGISLAETGCFHGIHFYFHTLLKKRWLRKHNRTEEPAIISLINGSIAGLIVQMLTSPLKVLQINSVLEKQKSAWELAVGIYKKEGIAGFWRGFGLNTILVINPAITFYAYGRLRKTAHKMGLKSHLVDFLCGFVAKVVATLITYPVMLLKTRLLSGEDESVKKIFMQVWKEGGLLGWYDGLGAKMLQTTLTSAFTFMCKEELVKHTLRMFVFLFAMKHAKNRGPAAAAAAIATK